MKAIFSIVAKNYIPLANVLGDSIKIQHPDIPFFVVVADTADGLIDFAKQRYTVIRSEQLPITNLKEMAFKYNVTEFCTALKPFAFKHLFDMGYEQVLYFDPDIYVFNPLDKLFESLNVSSMVITPHYQTPELTHSGLFFEGNVLFGGVFNLGFCGFRSSENGQKIIAWWSERLKHYCYSDRTDGLFVDQKWVNFIPVMFPEVHIERSLCYNIAVWNWHERRLSFRDDNYWVSNRITGGCEELVVFYHYSNYKFKLADELEGFMPIRTSKYADVEPISSFYAALLVKEAIGEKLSKLKYSFSAFTNDVPILQFHRRFYRQLLKTNSVVDDPFFAEAENSFYFQLNRKGLIAVENSADKLNETNFTGFNRKLKLLNYISKFAKTVIGFERYALLCKFMFKYVRPENQIFLMKSSKEKTDFINENTFINTGK